MGIPLASINVTALESYGESIDRLYARKEHTTVTKVNTVKANGAKANPAPKSSQQSASHTIHDPKVRGFKVQINESTKELVITCQYGAEIGKTTTGKVIYAANPREVGSNAMGIKLGDGRTLGLGVYLYEAEGAATPAALPEGITAKEWEEFKAFQAFKAAQAKG